jgi:hypothetical protein
MSFAAKNAKSAKWEAGDFAQNEVLQILVKRQSSGPQFVAWLAGTTPKIRATSESTAESAVRNLACRIFFGHNHFAQLPEGALQRIRLRPMALHLVVNFRSWEARLERESHR